jgi:hypothetical protein
VLRRLIWRCSTFFLNVVSSYDCARDCLAPVIAGTRQLETLVRASLSLFGFSLTIHARLRVTSLVVTVVFEVAFYTSGYGRDIQYLGTLITRRYR